MKTNKKQNTVVILIAVGVIVGSVFLTLAATGVLFGGRGGDGSGYQNITFTDAVMTCRGTTEANYAGQIQNLVTDNHSSRFDDRQFLYKIFLKMDLYDKARTRTSLHYVNCFVRSSNGQVRKYEVYEEVEENQNRVSDDTNMFGMPKRDK